MTHDARKALEVLAEAADERFTALEDEIEELRKELAALKRSHRVRAPVAPPSFVARVLAFFGLR